jgi:hypothetical protein
MEKMFFDTVPPLFGKLTTGQVRGMQRIIDYAQDRGTSRLHLAYVLSTIKHETANWMQPIREGAQRYGPSYTDASAKRAVTAIYDKGIIRTNYSLPAGPWGHSYYGRGLVQITWYENYKKFGIADDPDKALQWDTSLYITFEGMEKGMFTGMSMQAIETQADYYNARAIVNGDKAKWGRKIADEAEVFYKALAKYTPGEHPRVVVPEATVVVPPIVTKGDDDERNGSTDSRWTPAWWPFRSS